MNKLIHLLKKTRVLLPCLMLVTLVTPVHAFAPLGVIPLLPIVAEWTAVSVAAGAVAVNMITSETHDSRTFKDEHYWEKQKDINEVFINENNANQYKKYFNSFKDNDRAKTMYDTLADITIDVDELAFPYTLEPVDALGKIYSKSQTINQDELIIGPNKNSKQFIEYYAKLITASVATYYLVITKHNFEFTELNQKIAEKSKEVLAHVLNTKMTFGLNLTGALGGRYTTYYRNTSYLQMINSLTNCVDINTFSNTIHSCGYKLTRHDIYDEDNSNYDLPKYLSRLIDKTVRNYNFDQYLIGEASDTVSTGGSSGGDDPGENNIPTTIDTEQSSHSTQVRDMGYVHKKYANGDIYEGELSEEFEPEGYGVMNYPDGSVYSGYWQGGLWNGTGTHRSKTICEYVKKIPNKISTPHLSLMMNNNSNHENEELICSSDPSHTGQWQEGEMHGNGTSKDIHHNRYTGNWVGHMIVGEAQIKYTDGNIYEGELSEELEPQGNGVMTYPDGSVYSGTWQEGKRHGTGKLTYLDGRVYDGAWKEGERHGNGTYRDIHGNRYTGNWGGNGFSGDAQIKYANGDMYEGELSEELEPEGYGLMNYSDDSVYRGTWQVGVRHGMGTLQHYNSKSYYGNWEKGNLHSGEVDSGELHYEGELHNLEPMGLGVMTYKKGNILECRWDGFDVCQGQATYIDIDGNIYTGNWDGTRFFGVVQIKYTNGDVYEGDISVEFEPEGHGVMHYQDGRVYEGAWKNGFWNGIGRLTDLDGRLLFDGLWQYNAFQNNPSPIVSPLPFIDDDVPARTDERDKPDDTESHPSSIDLPPIDDDKSDDIEFNPSPIVSPHNDDHLSERDFKLDNSDDRESNQIPIDSQPIDDVLSETALKPDNSDDTESNPSPIVSPLPFIDDDVPARTDERDKPDDTESHPSSIDSQPIDDNLSETSLKPDNSDDTESNPSSIDPQDIDQRWSELIKKLQRSIDSQLIDDDLSDTSLKPDNSDDRESNQIPIDSQDPEIEGEPNQIPIDSQDPEIEGEPNQILPGLKVKFGYPDGGPDYPDQPDVSYDPGGDGPGDGDGPGGFDYPDQPKYGDGNPNNNNFFTMKSVNDDSDDPDDDDPDDGPDDSQDPETEGEPNQIPIDSQPIDDDWSDTSLKPDNSDDRESNQIPIDSQPIDDDWSDTSLKPDNSDDRESNQFSIDSQLIDDDWSDTSLKPDNSDDRESNQFSIDSQPIDDDWSDTSLKPDNSDDREYNQFSIDSQLIDDDWSDTSLKPDNSDDRESNQFSIDSQPIDDDWSDTSLKPDNSDDRESNQIPIDSQDPEIEGEPNQSSIDSQNTETQDTESNQSSFDSQLIDDELFDKIWESGVKQDNSDDIDQQRSALDKSNETDFQNNGNQDIIYSIIVITILSLLLALILLFI